ncbi:hypothetical protein DPMN_100927 [Dreissena polymorpha]|uniref:Uncharacterized protein n=1 Tax=Dreissena polymorpha TaxID=45954 RepID=A0A9D4LGQ6_DREPO|nr:hypothetical protein DPMN_100927 [Dreissena polymorpha]
MKLLVHNPLSLAISSVAMAMLIRNSAVLVQSLDGFGPNYVKMSTSSSVLPFMVMSALVLVVLFTMIFDLSVLTYIPNVFAILKSL